MTTRFFRAALAAVAVAVLALGLSGSGAAQQEGASSTWERIQRTGKVRMGVFDYPPYYVRDRATGEWSGALVEMGKDIARKLDVQFGLRLEDDARWQKFLDRWAEWNILLGHNEQRMKDSLGTVGIEEVPSTISFAPN